MVNPILWLRRADDSRTTLLKMAGEQGMPILWTPHQPFKWWETTGIDAALAIHTYAAKQSRHEDDPASKVLASKDIPIYVQPVIVKLSAPPEKKET
jgi:hypothetical protein